MRGITECYLCGRPLRPGNIFDASGILTCRECPYDWQKAQKLADRLRKTISRYEKREMRFWSEDKEMATMIRKDIRDLNKVASLIFIGEYRKALRKAESLDTAVRDEIPVSIWNEFDRQVAV